MSDGPNPPAGGNGHWRLLGRCPVDGAAIAVVDPCMFERGSATAAMFDGAVAAEDPSSGVQLWAGFGDGLYDVWGWVITDPCYGTERVAQIVVTMIDDEAMAEWIADTPRSEQR